MGLLQCGQNADCVPKVNSKSKVGTCQCREGFVFDSGGTCVASVTEKTVSKIFLFLKLKTVITKIFELDELRKERCRFS